MGDLVPALHNLLELLLDLLAGERDTVPTLLREYLGHAIPETLHVVHEREAVPDLVRVLVDEVALVA